MPGQEKKVKYSLKESGEFVIENYNFSKPFANFFPGIAGKYGIPMWVFYVNRGQAIASFGTRDKDQAILEFFPANKSWQLTSLRGFRTFVKLATGKRNFFYEPFHNGFANLAFRLSNRLLVTSGGLKIAEENLSLGLKTTVEYFTVPQEPYAALARIITIKNTARDGKKIQLIDGLPQIVPFGVSNLFLKKLGRTIEAWMGVENLSRGVPFYKLAVDPTDRPQVIHIKEGNFYLAFHLRGKKTELIQPIVDPDCIFGPISDFSLPYIFLETTKFRYPQKQIIKNKTPSGFAFLDFTLAAGEEKIIYSLIGCMRSQEILNASLPRIIQPDYFKAKQAQNQKIIQELQEEIATQSSSLAFDLYSRQTYLDNVIRGGYPLTFSASGENSVFYLYSRKHGDLERDYNKFQIQPTYFSQGNGNYRDTNQNRRSDVFFHPEIKEENLINFFNLLQTDGFNPLVVKSTNFLLRNKNLLTQALAGSIRQADILRLESFLEKPFTPGELIFFLEENNIKLTVSYDEFLTKLILLCQKNQEAEHGEGFWIDHWTYNLDLLENYLSVYPENLKEIIFEKRAFTFYDNSETVLPRKEKYILKDGLVRQLHSLASDSAKREMIRKRQSHHNLVRNDYGKGEIYQTTLINKILCLAVNKLSSLDPFGMGIDMEADKPNWYDALNGLPALFGSSLNETFELKRLLLFIKKAIRKTDTQKIYLTQEIADFLVKLAELLKTWRESRALDKDYQYWDKSCTLKEDYRQSTRFGFNGKETQINVKDLSSLLEDSLEKINRGIEKAKDEKNNLYCGYFINEVSEYAVLKPPFIKPLKFTQKKLPFFLEAQVHALRITDDKNEAKKLHQAVKASALFDKKLKMYRVSEELNTMPEEIGRCRVFTPGWLEHASIWLHMEYKYLLEILKCGLYAEFYAEFKNVLIPFQPPQRYGRSILENSSFLASSILPDSNMQGNGFLARLSGSTAEFLQIWLIMNLGGHPFFLNPEGKLNLQFQPILAGWLFKKDTTYRFKLFGKINLTYHNPQRKNTFGSNAAKPVKIIFQDKDGKTVEINSAIIPSPYAEQIRSCQIEKIEIILG